jgi:hypothetical protein
VNDAQCGEMSQMGCRAGHGNSRLLALLFQEAPLDFPGVRLSTYHSSAQKLTAAPHQWVFNLSSDPYVVN